jgi:hypothetical protein
MMSAAKQPLKRQVFISHTGKDEDAKTFSASILKPALEAAGLAVYMDFQNLELGSKWPQELVDTAANSMVVVVVLSRSYTSRFWCMLELDLALHAHKRQPGMGGENDRLPLILPVFYDSVDMVVDADKIRQQWSGNLQRQLWKEEELGSEWVVSVDVDRWVANIASLKEQVQHMRKSLPGQASAKDEAWQMARGVVRVAARHMPSLVAVGKVVGFEQQEAALVSELGGRLGLWLYGQGGWQNWAILVEGGRRWGCPLCVVLLWCTLQLQRGGDQGRGFTAIQQLSTTICMHRRAEPWKTLTACVGCSVSSACHCQELVTQ